MEDYQMHKEEYARSLQELTAKVMGNPKAALCQSLLSFSLLNEALSKHGPVRLYKYQPFDERNIRDFLSGVIHMSSPDSFNDVNEGWQRFDESVVRDEVNRASDFDIDSMLMKEWDSLEEAMDKVKPDGPKLTVDQVAALWDASIGAGGDLSDLADCMLAASQNGMVAIRESARCASLSETVSSASMWDRYADGHKGFALGYDFHAFNPGCCIGRDHAEEPDAAGLLLPVLYGKRVDLSVLFMACCLFQVCQTQSTICIS